MLIEGAGVEAHRPTPVPFFILFRYEKLPSHSISIPAYCSMQPQYT